MAASLIRAWQVPKSDPPESAAMSVAASLERQTALSVPGRFRDMTSNCLVAKEVFIFMRFLPSISGWSYGLAERYRQTFAFPHALGYIFDGADEGGIV